MKDRSMRKRLRKPAAAFCTIVLGATCVASPAFSTSSELATLHVAQLAGDRIRADDLQMAQYYPDNPYGQQSYGEQSYMGQSPHQAGGGSPYGSYGGYGGAPYRRPESGPFIYPSRGQTPQQEQTDKGQCY